MHILIINLHFLKQNQNDVFIFLFGSFASSIACALPDCTHFYIVK